MQAEVPNQATVLPTLEGPPIPHSQFVGGRGYAKLPEPEELLLAACACALRDHLVASISVSLCE